MSGELRSRILARLAKGPATFGQLHVAIPHGFRELDRTLQQMRKEGIIVSLPRIKKVRPFAEWALAPGAPSPDTV